MATATREQFFQTMEEQGIALTYDDVRMRTRSGSSGPLPEVINIRSKFSENVELKVPLVSAAMDTVTESNMAIEMAKLGGIGVIHAALSINEQFTEVRRVKKASHSVIDEPISVRDSDTLESVKKMCAEKRFNFSTFTVIDADGKFKGVLTGKDFEYPESLTVSVGEAMTSVEEDNFSSAPVGTTLEEAYAVMQKGKINTLPLINEDGGVGGLYLWSDVKRNVRDAEAYNVDHNRQLRVAAAVSTGEDALERVEALSRYADVIVLDTADGDSYYVFKTLKAIKEKFPDLDVVVGNISDGASALELAEAGANGIKVGQGGGSICSTRPETGIGMPQVTAVYDCMNALREKYPHIPVCADGGIKDHGDIPIAIGVGAHSVMMGRVLAGTKEAPGDVLVRKDGTRYKTYRGMGSASALRDNEASRERYSANGGIFLPEGVEAYVPYEGDLKNVLGLCVLALRKGMRYVKSPDLEYHRNHTKFFRITGSGLRESHPHDVEIIKQ
ncbi:MAG: IMP dehydrogenase [Patescibacteria group bacterium]|nr:IMP dehydrogenase [Patescibacteria group bacterium]